MPGVRAFVILPRWALRGGPPANLIVATGDGLDEKKLTAAVNRLAPSATISFRSDALAALTSAPLQHGTYVMFVAGIAAAGIFGAAVLLLSLAIGARSRSLILALLSTVGLGRGQARLLVAAEAVPPILASMVGGAACAWALAPLTGPALDLSVFTGSAQPVTLHADLVALAVPATGAILLGLLVLTAHTVISAGRDMSSVLRWDG
jgi:putative ABC transport system permease protein